MKIMGGGKKRPKLAGTQGGYDDGDTGPTIGGNDLLVMREDRVIGTHLLGAGASPRKGKRAMKEGESGGTSLYPSCEGRGKVAHVGEGENWCKEKETAQI